MIKSEMIEKEIGFDPIKRYTERAYTPAPGTAIEEAVAEMKFRKRLEYLAERKAVGL